MAYVTAATAKATNTQLADFSDADVNAAIAEFETLAETYCDQAFVTRTATEQIQERPLRSHVKLNHKNLIALTSITVDGVALSLTNVTKLKARGELLDVPFTNPYALDATVVYTHGQSSCPTDIAWAAIEYATRELGSRQSGTSGDVRWQSADGVTSFITVDWSQGRPTRWSSVNDRLNRYTPPTRRVMVG